MRVIVPGGYYSYDSAGKKIWLDYQYYGTTLENIERVKNLTRNKILYDYKRSTVLPTVENGCITHSYQGTEADTDKIQVTLKTPITNSLTELTPVDGVVTLETDGKVLVLPTENAAILPSFNQSVLDPNRLTIAESPFGGLKTGSPDYAVGTLYTPTDGVYLTDVAGNNSTKTLTAGMLKGVNGLTVDTEGHTITEDFQIVNTGTNNPLLMMSAASATGWAFTTGSGDISSDGTNITLSGTPASGILRAAKVVSPGVALGTCKFVVYTITASVNCNLNFLLSSNNTLGTNFAYFNGTKFLLPANTPKTFVLPIYAPAGSSGQNPNEVSGTLGSTIQYLRIGVEGAGASPITVTFGNITADVAKSAYIELQTPDNLADSSLTLQAWDGSAYQTTGTYKLDSSYSAVSTTTANWKLSDGTKFDDVYGSGLGRALFPKGAAEETKAGSSGSITYSANKGTSKRIGFRFDLPPSDGGRTNFNKCRMKSILSYAPDAENDYSASFDFADSTNTSYGLQNLSKPWVALYDPADSLIDFYLFTHRPQNLSFKRDETGTIYSISLYPGAGSVYHGQIPFADLTLDTNSDSVPDCLEAAVNGSVTKFLDNYTMVI